MFVISVYTGMKSKIPGWDVDISNDLSEPI